MHAILGLAFGGVAIGVNDPAGAVFEILFFSVLFGAFMYCFVYREYAHSIVEELRAPPTAALESNMRTMARGALRTAPLGVVLLPLTIWDSGALSFAAGFGIGNGIGLLLTSRWFRGWEKDHQRRLLREPRWRWRSSRWRGWRGWSRGRGIFEPKDFYAMGSTMPGA